LPGRTMKLIWSYDPAIYAPARYKRACAYQVFIPDPLEGQNIILSAELAGTVAEADVAIRALNDGARPALAPLARLLLRTESIASSRVEGMQLGARELARAESKLETGARVGSTALEVLGNIDAMELAVQEAAIADQFGLDEIVAIHRRLMERAPNRHIAGQVRTRQNWIGGNDYNPCGADFVPPPPEYVAPLLADLCNAINSDLLPPLIQAALVHAQFETIHPFDDGNGRTGRALVHVILRRRAVAPQYVPPISVLLAGAKDRYIKGLTDFREGRINEWIEYFAAAAAGSARLASAYVQAVQDLGLCWRNQLAGAAVAPRADAAAWAVIEILPAHPVITVPVAAAATRRSRPAIYQAMKQLEDAGVLESLSSSRRNQSWEPVGLLDLLTDLEAGKLPVARTGPADNPHGWLEPE
jgi:Fic family protein